jgi:geranylgeranyl reductase family protein
MSASTWDLVVVGAGPAGSAAAIAAKRANASARVLIVDKAAAGRDKVCGDGIGPDAVRLLTRLGAAEDALRPEEAISRFRIEVVNGPALDGTPPEPGYVVPRAEFDKRLLERALAEGAEFLQDSVTGAQQDSSGVRLATKSGAALQGKFVVAADGAYSPVRRSLGVEPNRGRHMATAIRGYATEASDHSKVLYIGWDRGGRGLTYVWKFPTGDGRFNVGYGTTHATREISAAFLNERLRELLGHDVKLDGVRMRGHQLPLSTSRPRPAHGRVLLTGDAASLVNPLSGEGIVYALLSGELAGTAAVVATDPGVTYRAGLQAALGRHHRHVSVLARLATPTAVTAALRGAAGDPHSLDALLGVSLGTGSFTLTDVTRFAVSTLAAPTRKAHP